MFPFAVEDVLHGVLRAEDVGVQHKAVLILFDFGHTLGLVFWGAVVVDDSDPSSKGHCYGHLRLGHLNQN